MEVTELSRAVPYLWRVCDGEEAQPALNTERGRVIAIITPVTAEASATIAPLDSGEHTGQDTPTRNGAQPYDKQAALDFLRSLEHVSDEDAQYNSETVELLKKALPHRFAEQGEPSA